MHKMNEYQLARALYEGLPSISNLAEKMAREYGKAGALSFFEMMGPDVQFFWEDIARQIINHSKEWLENKGSCCRLSEREQKRLHEARIDYFSKELVIGLTQKKRANNSEETPS